VEGGSRPYPFPNKRRLPSKCATHMRPPTPRLAKSKFKTYYRNKDRARLVSLAENSKFRLYRYAKRVRIYCIEKIIRKTRYRNIR
jgi:hypothetical protein